MSSSCMSRHDIYIIISPFEVYLGERVTDVIELTKLKGEKFALNSDQIETMEATPDTVITLLNGHKYVVRERVTEIISLIESFKRRASAPPSL